MDISRKIEFYRPSSKDHGQKERDCYDMNERNFVAARGSFEIRIGKEVDGCLLVLSQNKWNKEDTNLREFLTEHQKIGQRYYSEYRNDED